MLRDFVTPEAFEIGIIRYLKRFSYQNTVSRHLWESLTDVSAYRPERANRLTLHGLICLLKMGF